MKRFLSFLLLAIAIFSLKSENVYADGSTANVTISKTVLNPKTNNYVKNLSINDAIYHPGDTVVFHITLSNTSNQTIQQLILKDMFPPYITFVSGVGSYDQKNKILSFLTYNLKPNTTQSFAIIAQIVPRNQFPSNQSTICTTNKVTMVFGQNQTAQDSAQFCTAVTQTVQITNQPLPTASQMTQKVYPPATTQSTPSTGVPTGLLGILVSSALAGSILIYKTGNLQRAKTPHN